MKKMKITPKEKMHAAIEGRITENFPVIAPYMHLSNADHWTELTGLPVWKFYEWILSNPDKHAEMYKLFYETLPFDAVQPWGIQVGENMQNTSRAFKENTEIVWRDNIPYFHYKGEDRYEKVPETIHESGSGGGECEQSVIFDIGDVKEKIKPISAQKRIELGCNDYLDEIVKMYGKERFIINGGVVNTFYSNVYYLGMINFYTLLHDKPELVHYMSESLLEQNIEIIRSHAKAGGDAIYIDDATATSDMISTEMYEKFSLPYMIQQVKEIHNLGKKAILIYFGGISDRVDLIRSIGADLLIMEASMKSFTNDYAAIAKQLGGQTALAGNLNPYEDLESTNDEALAQRIQSAVEIGKKYGKYVTSTGSPITPNTSVKRIQKFIEWGHS